jgi:hypothetical protein
MWIRGATRGRPLWLVLLVVLGHSVTAVAAARAADTGSVSGMVFDPAGQPMAEVTVTISGNRPPVRRTAQTDANGRFLFEYLLPGEFALDFAKSGVGAARRVAVIEVGRDTQVDVVLGLTVQEQVTVTASLPLVDVRSTEVSFNFTADTINSLPLERTYQGLFQLIPGVADNRSTVGPSAGGSRQDNSYLIDGVNIGNPAYGHLATDVNELDIAEVNVKRAGVSAEFGRTAGTVTNAVSRSGTNDFRGIGRVDWLPPALIAGYELPSDLLAAGVRPGAFQDPLLTSDRDAALGVGGPIARDRIFFYGSARYYQRTKPDRRNKLGTVLPDEIRSGPELYGKINVAAGPQHQLSGSYRHRPGRVENAGLTSDFAPTVAVQADNGSRAATTEWTSFLDAHSSLNARFLHYTEHNEDVPVRQLGYLPAFDPSRLTDMGQYTDPAQANLVVGGNQFTNTQNYRRNELRGTYTRLFQAGRSSHTLKGGAGFELGEETFNRLANGWGAIVNVTVNGIPALRARYFTPQAAQVGQGRTYSIFVQDEVAVGRASVNAGVLLNRDEFAQRVEASGGCPAAPLFTGGTAVYESHGDTCTFMRFGFGDEVQPRLGVSYQLRAGTGDKAYASWGRYHNMDQKSSGRSLAPNRIYQTQTIFDLAGNLLSTGPLASTTGKGIDPALEPIYTDEFLVGYATPLSELFTLDLFFMSRDMKRFIEDIPSRLAGTAPDSGPFVAANLPCRAFAACRDADARRTYRAFTIDARRRLSNGWMADVNYTWSRFEGNFDLDYSLVAVFNTSSFVQDAPGTNVEDPNRFGPLFEDRPHVLKVFTAYAPTSTIAVSGYLRMQSGTPWAARGRDAAGALLNYLEPAGTHRNPIWTNLDLMATYRVPLPVARVAFEARIMNVFDNQTRLSTDSQQFLDLRTAPQPPYILPYLQPNPLFGTGNAFAPPRRLSLAATVEF